MKLFYVCLAGVVALPSLQGAERVGTVDFGTSCSAAVEGSFNRAVALLHDFWYEEAQKQFEEIAQQDAGCSMAHWGAALSTFHQIWNRPDEKVMAHGWEEMQKAQTPRAKTDRERRYIGALSDFFRPGPADYQKRVETYAADMAKLFKRYPKDEDAGAFYALALLAEIPPSDSDLTNNRKALAVLKPLFAEHPGHPGLAHYIIHACDTPALAKEGLGAAEKYGEIAPSAPHAVHMPGHIFARLGMWQRDIEVNLLSVAASEAADAKGQSGAFDQLHADDFLLYAYLQSGQDKKAKELVDKTAELLTRFEAMPHMSTHGMDGMFAMYRNEFPAFYLLEMRDWAGAEQLTPVTGSLPQAQLSVYWARAIGAGHLRQADVARQNLAKFEELLAETKKGKNAYQAEGTGVEIELDELRGWSAFAEGKGDEALKLMRAGADLQDKVGQGEVDIPAREMLADLLLALHEPAQALKEYEAALQLSPNRLNGLYGAGLAAEGAGERVRAAQYYGQLLKSTNGGADSGRSEFGRVREFVAGVTAARAH